MGWRDCSRALEDSGVFGSLIQGSLLRERNWLDWRDCDLFSTLGVSVQYRDGQKQRKWGQEIS